MTDFDDKKILIWGYGREGKSSEAFLKRNASAALLDIYEGGIDGIDRDRYDLIFKSPGIRFDEKDPKFISQTEVFLKSFRGQTVGITGTKGKSTTSTLLYSVLSKCTDRPVILLGNIGTPCLDHYDEIEDDTIIVFEMSAHQLKDVDVSPHIAVFLNLYEEHLDYYDTLDRYFAAKSNIAAYQRTGDHFYAGDNVPYIATKAQTSVISAKDVGNYDLLIPGEHNRFNAEFVFRIATEQFGCEPAAVKEALAHTKGLPHRLEYICKKGDLTFYDDSISTIPEAAISALSSIQDAKTILIGGMDRGIDYSVLAEYIKQHEEFNYICMYASGRKIYDSEGIAGRPNVYYEEDLENAVHKAVMVTDRGAVILSPAAASYDHFKNFEERGDCFRQMIMLL